MIERGYIHIETCVFERCSEYGKIRVELLILWPDFKCRSETGDFYLID